MATPDPETDPDSGVNNSAELRRRREETEAAEHGWREAMAAAGAARTALEALQDRAAAAQDRLEHLQVRIRRIEDELADLRVEQADAATEAARWAGERGVAALALEQAEHSVAQMEEALGVRPP